MKRSTIVYLIVLGAYLVYFFTCRYPFVDFESNSASGIQFSNNSFKEALTEANNSDKLLFLDVYATWCGPCKRLKKFVFSDEKVGALFNQNFVSIAFDAEEGEGIDVATKYNVQQYPTLLFLNANGEVVYQFSGYLETDELINMGEEVLKQ